MVCGNGFGAAQRIGVAEDVQTKVQFGLLSIAVNAECNMANFSGMESIYYDTEYDVCLRSMSIHAHL